MLQGSDNPGDDSTLGLRRLARKRDSAMMVC